MKWFSVGLVWRAVLTWAVPFLVSCALFDPEGNLVIDVRVFKAIMVAIFSVTGAFCVRGAIKTMEVSSVERLSPYTNRIGAFFVGVNCIMDVVFFIPFANAQQRNKANAEPMTVGSWFAQIGVGYIAIFMQAWLAGNVADWAVDMQTEKVE